MMQDLTCKWCDLCALLNSKIIQNIDFHAVFHLTPPLISTIFQSSILYRSFGTLGQSVIKIIPLYKKEMQSSLYFILGSYFSFSVVEIVWIIVWASDYRECNPVPSTNCSQKLSLDLLKVLQNQTGGVYSISYLFNKSYP